MDTMKIIGGLLLQDESAELSRKLVVQPPDGAPAVETTFYLFPVREKEGRDKKGVQ